MKRILTAKLATIAILAASIDYAEPRITDMPTDYLDGLNAKLIANGYSGMRVVDQTKLVLSAFDASGSEVIMVAHPSSNQILRMNYVHPRDE